MGFVLVLTGPTGAGKSTIARLLASRLPECANIEVDHVKHFLVSAYRYEEPTGVDQWRLLGANLGLLAANYEAAGYNVIINGFLTLEAWQALEAQVRPAHRVLLLPSLEVNLLRNITRRWDDQLEDDDVAEHHAFFSKEPYFNTFTRIDSTSQTADETADTVSNLLTQ